MDDVIERQLREITSRIIIVRNVNLFILLISIVQMIVAVVLPDALDQFIKSWLLVVVGGFFLGLVVATIFARNDPTITLFINMLSSFVSGIITGVSLFMIIIKVKNG